MRIFILKWCLRQHVFSFPNIMSVNVPYSLVDQFTEIEIDCVVQACVVASYTFDTICEHNS